MLCHLKLFLPLLQNYKLDFNYRSRRWQGAVATVVETPGSHVWGVVWIKKNGTIAALDEYKEKMLLVYL